MFFTGTGGHSSGLECKFYWFQLKTKFCESYPQHHVAGIIFYLINLFSPITH